MKRIIAATLSVVALTCPALAQEYRIGRASADITLPVWGIQMLGYVHPQQVGEGLRQRQYARTFVIADAADKTRLAYVVCDIAFPTHTLKLAVLERTREKLGDRYGHANLILTGTHTHGAPGGYHHHLSSSVLGGDFFEQGFEALADGIAESLASADADLKPGRVLLAQGDVDQANANRSSIAYRNNPESERAQYKHDVDKTMTLLKFVREEGEVGLLNWFAVHPTSVNYHYKLTTSDNKGYAAYEVERNLSQRSPGFVAAFANSNCGDATPNLNLDATGPGQTDIESCALIGGRQAETAMRLMGDASQPLSGPIQIVHAFVDFSQLAVAEEFTGAEEARTCPSAWGYAFAAGSDAEGGGHQLFREGMTESDPAIDALVRLVLPKTKPPEEFKKCQSPKAILVATGLAQPPMHEQVLPLSVVRLGQLALVVGPAEFTTMSGRRFRIAVARELGIAPAQVIVAGYANDFAGYVTTWHEYQLQQYEGGHTLFGPWTEAGYRQEFVRLARALKSGTTVESSAEPTDMRTRRFKKTALDGPDERAPDGAPFGEIATKPEAAYKPGDTVACTFWTGSPVNEYRRTDEFLAVEQLVQAPDTWRKVRGDHEWDTTVHWRQLPAPGSRGNRAAPQPGLLNLAPPRYAARPEPFQATVTWETSRDTAPGTYRLVHYGRHKRYGKVERFTAVSPPFELRP